MGPKPVRNQHAFQYAISRMFARYRFAAREPRLVTQGTLICVLMIFAVLDVKYVV